MISKNVLRFVLSLKIRQLRTNKNLSLKELAERSGLSHSYLNEIEKGKKYPKVEKLIALAQALDVSFEELVSANMGRNLNPLLTYLESDLAKDLPLDAFGIGEHDVYQLMSHAPEKFASFLMTILEIGRSYDLKIGDLNKAALRSYQEIHDNYFEELEQKAQETRRELGFNEEQAIDTASLKAILIEKFNYKVDEDILTAREETSQIRSVLKRGKRNAAHRLYINKNLASHQKSFIYAREIGHCVLKQKQKKVTGTDVSASKFQDILGDFHASYFSGAFLINENSFVTDLKQFFAEEKFHQEEIRRLLKKYNVSTEVLMHRITQIMPKHFGVSHLFFLRCNEDYVNMPKKYYISKELHLGQLHNPHGVSLHEHYCRRWITTWLLDQLSSQMVEKGNSSKIVDAQVSEVVKTGDKYFCISVARNSHTKKNTNSCLTIGFLMNDAFNNVCKFVNDQDVPERIVAQTCERCPVQDCRERGYEPVVYMEELAKAKKKKAIADLIG